MSEVIGIIGIIVTLMVLLVCFFDFLLFGIIYVRFEGMV